MKVRTEKKKHSSASTSAVLLIKYSLRCRFAFIFAFALRFLFSPRCVRRQLAPYTPPSHLCDELLAIFIILLRHRFRFHLVFSCSSFFALGAHTAFSRCSHKVSNHFLGHLISQPHTSHSLDFVFVADIRRILFKLFIVKVLNIEFAFFISLCPPPLPPSSSSAAVGQRRALVLVSFDAFKFATPQIISL